MKYLKDSVGGRIPPIDPQRSGAGDIDVDYSTESQG